MWHEFWIAIALLLVIEGVMPFLNPPTFRKTLQTMIELSDSTLRTMGFFGMLAGLVLLYLVNG